MTNLASIRQKRYEIQQRQQEAERLERERLAAEQANTKAIEQAQRELAALDAQERRERAQMAVEAHRPLIAQNQAKVREFYALLDEMEQFIGQRCLNFEAVFADQIRRHEQLVYEGMSNAAPEPQSALYGRDWGSYTLAERKELARLSEQHRAAQGQARQQFENPLPQWAAVSQWVANCSPANPQHRLIRQAIAYIYLNRIINPPANYNAQADVDENERLKSRGR